MAALGCSLVAGPEYRRVLGIVDIGDARARILRAPDTTRVGIPFQVEVGTYGSGSCTRADGTTVTVQGNLAEIVLFDRERVGGACTTDLSPFQRTTTVQFDEAGTATLRVRGRSLYRTVDRGDSVVVFERSIVVR